MMFHFYIPEGICFAAFVAICNKVVRRRQLNLKSYYYRRFLLFIIYLTATCFGRTTIFKAEYGRTTETCRS
jgi:hypothetical protein